MEDLITFTHKLQDKSQSIENTSTISTIKPVEISKKPKEVKIKEKPHSITTETKTLNPTFKTEIRHDLIHFLQNKEPVPKAFVNNAYDRLNIPKNPIATLNELKKNLYRVLNIDPKKL